MYKVRIDTKAFSVSFQLQWTLRKTQKETHKTTTIEWVLCSSSFKDIDIIALQNLNNIPVTSQYEEILTKRMHNRYFEAGHCKNQQMKERRPKRSIGNLRLKT